MEDHIQIGDIAPRVVYVADGVTSTFTYPRRECLTFSTFRKRAEYKIRSG